MSTRRAFLGVAAGMAVVAASGRAGDAQDAATPAPSSPSPKPTAAATTAKPPSAAARELAERMRHFDSSLSDTQVTTIARGIDDNLRLGGALKIHGKRLRNSDEPAPGFSVNE